MKWRQESLPRMYLWSQKDLITPPNRLWLQSGLISGSRCQEVRGIGKQQQVVEKKDMETEYQEKKVRRRWGWMQEGTCGSRDLHFIWMGWWAAHRGGAMGRRWSSPDPEEEPQSPQHKHFAVLKPSIAGDTLIMCLFSSSFRSSPTLNAIIALLMHSHMGDIWSLLVPKHTRSTSICVCVKAGGQL